MTDKVTNFVRSAGDLAVYFGVLTIIISVILNVFGNFLLHRKEKICVVIFLFSFYIQVVVVCVDFRVGKLSQGYTNLIELF